MTKHTQSNVDIVSSFAEELFEHFNGEAAARFVSQDFRAHPWAPYGIPDGPEGVKQFAEFMASAFRNARRTTADIIASDDKVVVRYIFEADHTGNLMGIAPTGKRVRLPGIFIARVENGKVAEYWREEDMLELMHQLNPPVAAEV